MKTSMLPCAVLLIVNATFVQAATEGDAPTGLLCEMLADPSVAKIVDPRPEFGWIVNSPTPNDVQTAYHILVASSEDKLGEDARDVWDSGKVASNASIDVEYRGEDLRPGATYFWKVRTWNRAGKAGQWSTAQRFTMHDPKVPYKPAEGEYVTPPGVIQHVRFSVDRGDSREAAPGLWRCGTTRYPLTYTEVRPKSVAKTDDGRYFVDFGRAGFAYLRLKLTTDADGEEVEIRLGEKADGQSVDIKPGGAIRRVLTSVTLQKGTHDYVPKFSGNARMPLGVHVTPFRYCEIVGSPVEIDKSMLTQVVYHYPFDEDASHFHCSDKTLNDVWNMCKYTIKATSVCGVYIDGDRQRDILHGDGFVNQLCHYCVDREFTMARYSHEVLTMARHWSCEWMMCSPLMAWHDYMNTGNTESLARYYDVLKIKTLHGLARDDGLIGPRLHDDIVKDWLVDRETCSVTAIEDAADRKEALETIVRGEGMYIERLKGSRGKEALKTWARYRLTRMANDDRPAKHAELDKLIDWAGSRHLVDIIDWPGCERDGYEIVDVCTVPNAMHYGTLIAMRDIAAALGKKDDVRFFEQRAKLVKNSINEKLFDEQRGVYIDGEGSGHASLHANMFPLAFGVVPEDRKDSVSAFVKSRNMACSVYGAQYLLDGLYEADEQQHALELMRSKELRSWAHMIYDVGTTIAMEAWDIRFKRNLDWNHPWGAVPANIIPRRLMGIRPLEPGFAKVLIKPMPGDLKQAECKMPTIRGPIGVKFDNAPGQSFTMQIDLPGNTTAKVGVPLLGNQDTTVLLNGKPVEGRIEANYLFIDSVGSGRHTVSRQSN